MSYYLNLHPTKEAIDKLKNSTWINKEAALSMQNESKRSILLTCLSDNDINNHHKIGSFLTMSLKSITNTLKAEAIHNAIGRYNEEKGELWYCGWQYSQWEENFNTEEGIEKYIQDTVEHLLILAIIVKTPDYFENSERFYDKWNEINEKIDGFIEVIYEQMNYWIINELKEFIEKDEDSTEELND